MAVDFQVRGGNTAALFTLKLYRGDGMTLLAMNWKKGTPAEPASVGSTRWIEPASATGIA